MNMYRSAINAAWWAANSAQYPHQIVLPRAQSPRPDKVHLEHFVACPVHDEVRWGFDNVHAFEAFKLMIDNLKDESQ